MIAHLPLSFYNRDTNDKPVRRSSYLLHFLFTFFFLIGGNLYVIIEIFSFYSVVFVCFPSIQCSPFCLARTIDILVWLAIILLQVMFINRLGGVDVKPYKEKILAEIDKHLSLTQYEVCCLLSEIFREIIADLHREGKYVKIETDEKIIENFTKNFHDLHTYVKINYRRLGAAIDMSLGNLTRLEKGKEPMLSAVIKMADFFGVTITQILSENPNFDYAKIQKTIDKKSNNRQFRA